MLFKECGEGLDTAFAGVQMILFYFFKEKKKKLSEAHESSSESKVWVTVKINTV